MTHDLKTWPEAFAQIQAGLKTFEVRKNDRKHKFRVGDILNLKEYDPRIKLYSGQEIEVRVTYVIGGLELQLYGLEVADNIAVMAIKRIDYE